jgi:hypothetical protein
LVLWQAGRNTIEFEIYATARQINGLSAVEVGDASVLQRSSYQRLAWLQIEVVQGLTWLSALLGGLCLIIGLTIRANATYFWFGLTCIARVS